MRALCDIREKTVSKENVFFTSCFNNGVRFYTIVFGGYIIWGFINPQDQFDPSKVELKTFTPFHDDGVRSLHNYRKMERPHEISHLKLVQELSLGNFCPQRLRKYLKK